MGHCFGIEIADRTVLRVRRLQLALPKGACILGIGPSVVWQLAEAQL